MLSFKPRSTVEATVFDLWKELTPSGAFISGLSEYAGQMLVPDPSHMEDLVRKMDDANCKAEMNAQWRLLASLRAYLSLALIGEAQIAPDVAIEAFFAHLIKEGMVPGRLVCLANHASKALTAYATTKAYRECPIGIKILTSIRCAGLVEVADTIKKQTRSRRLQLVLDDLLGAVIDYSKSFGLAGFKNSGYDEIVEICSREGCELGRSDYYANTLLNLFDYSESPMELEAKGLAMLDRELGSFKHQVEELAPKLGVKARAEAVAHAISTKSALKTSQVVGYVKDLKQHMSKLVNGNIVKINSRYRPKSWRRQPTSPEYFRREAQCL